MEMNSNSLLKLSWYINVSKKQLRQREAEEENNSKTEQVELVQGFVCVFVWGQDFPKIDWLETLDLHEWLELKSIVNYINI
jgi:hypothetical protein